MDAISSTHNTTPHLAASGGPARIGDYRLEAAPFEGRLQRDAFVRPQVDGDQVVHEFIARARSTASAGARGPEAHVLNGADPRLSSPRG
jgi:hypothetical protein